MTDNADSTAADELSKLTFVERLLPPLKSIGQGPNALQYPPQSPAWSVDFSRDGKWLAVSYGAPDPCVRLWTKNDDSSSGGGRVVVGQSSSSSSSPSSPPPSKMSKSNSNQWVLHSTLSGVHQRTIRSVAFAPITAGGAYVLAAASFDASVSIWEYSSDKKIAAGSAPKDEWECTTQLEGHDHEIKAVIWNGTGSLLATCGRDKTVWIWETWLDGSVGGSELNEFECVAVLSGSDADVKCIQFAPSHGQWGDGDEILVSAGYDDTIRIWAEDSGDWYCAMSLDNIHMDTIWSLTMAPGGGRLVSASADGSISILKGYTIAERNKMETSDGTTSSNGLWKCVGKLPEAHSSTIYSIHYAPAKAGHGRIVSAGADNRIQIYHETMGSTSDQPSFILDAAVDTNHGDINCVRWHPWDGSVLCSAGDDGSVQFWHFESS